MAGLLDFFNPPQGGLLGEDDRRRAQQSALMGLAGGLLSAGQPSRIPVGFGPALGQGLMGYAQAQNDAMDSAVKAKLMGQQFEKGNMELQRARDQQAAMQRIAGRFGPTGGSPFMGPGTQVADASGQIGAPSYPASFDLASVVSQPGAFNDFIMAGYDPVGLMTAMRKDKKTTVLKPGEVAYDETTGEKRFEVPPLPKALELKEIREGSKIITYEIRPDGSRVRVAEAPAWKPEIGGGMPKLTPAQKAVDEAFAKDYADLVVGGAAADIGKNLQQLRGVVNQLKSETGLTGPGIGALPDQARAAFAPKSMAAQEAVEEVVQRNLRLVLGAQFTEKEGERLIRRSYNPSLGQAENVKRLERLSGAIEKAYRSKMEAARYFENYGTLQGYQGTTRWTIGDFENAIDGRETPAGSGGTRRLKFNPATGELE